MDSQSSTQSCPSRGRIKSSTGCLTVSGLKGKAAVGSASRLCGDILEYLTVRTERPLRFLLESRKRRAGRPCRLEALRWGGFCLQEAFLSPGPSGRPRPVLSAVGLWTQRSTLSETEPGLLMQWYAPHLLTPQGLRSPASQGVTLGQFSLRPQVKRISCPHPTLSVPSRLPRRGGGGAVQGRGSRK